MSHKRRRISEIIDPEFDDELARRRFDNAEVALDGSRDDEASLQLDGGPIFLETKLVGEALAAFDVPELAMALTVVEDAAKQKTARDLSLENTRYLELATLAEPTKGVATLI